MRTSSANYIVYKHTMEIMLDFLNEYDWRVKEIMFSDFQLYVTSKIPNSDYMWWANEQDQNRNLAQAK